MLLDPETLDLAQGIEAVLADVPARARRAGQAGAVPVRARGRDHALRHRRRRRRAARRAAPPRRLDRGAQRHAPRRRRHPSVRPLRRPGDRRSPPLPGADRGPRLHRRARADLRHPRPRRHRLGRQGDLRRRRDPPAPAAAARPLVQLAVLGGPPNRADVGPDAGLPGLPEAGRAAALRQLGDLRPPRRADDELGRDRGLHVPLVGRPPAPAARHRRDADLRPGDPDRGHGGVRGADAVALAPLRASCSTRASRSSRRRSSSSTTTRSAPRSAAWRASSSTSRSAGPCRPPRWRRRSLAQVEPSAAELGCSRGAAPGRGRSSPAAPGLAGSSPSSTTTATTSASSSRRPSRSPPADPGAARALAAILEPCHRHRS